MAQETINSDVTNLSIRTALNSMLTELYAAIVAAGGNDTALETIANSENKLDIRTALNTMFSDLYTQVVALGGDGGGGAQTLVNGESRTAFRAALNSMLDELYPSIGSLAGGGAWDPSFLGSALKWWVEADVGAYKDAGSTLAANTESVQQWNDQSGNGHHISQSTSGLRPVFTTNVFGTKPAIAFDGTDDVMFSSSWTLAQPFTVFMVYKYGSSLAGRYSDVFTGDNTGGYLGATVQAVRSGGSSYIYAGTLEPMAGLAVNTKYLFVVTFNGSSSGWAYNGSSLTTAGPGTLGIVNGVSIGLVGGVAAESANALMAEVFVVGGTITTLNRQKAEGYLAWKYGLQASLPGGHPYAGAAP
jgi:hypothetical protein